MLEQRTIADKPSDRDMLILIDCKGHRVKFAVLAPGRCLYNDLCP